MLGLLDFLGTLGSNILSLPGILGLVIGMATRSYSVAMVGGALAGLLKVLIFADFRFEMMPVLDLGIAVVVGIVAALVGCLIRHKGATV